LEGGTLKTSGTFEVRQKEADCGQRPRQVPVTNQKQTVVRRTAAEPITQKRTRIKPSSDGGWNKNRVQDENLDNVGSINSVLVEVAEACDGLRR